MIITRRKPCLFLILWVCLGLTAPILAVEEFIYEFDGVAGCGAECLDPNIFTVTVTDLPCILTEHTGDSHLRMESACTFRFNNLTYAQNNLAPGNFELEFELDGLLFSGGSSDNQIHFIDPDAVDEGSNAIFIIQYIFQDGNLNLNALPFPTFGATAGVSLGTDTTSLNIRVTYIDDPAVPGGNWSISYDKNDTGYTLLGNFIPTHHPYDAAPNRQFLAWVASIAEGAFVSARVDRFAVRPLNFATSPQPPDGAERVDPETDICWTNFDGATGSNVYFGTDLTDVEEATPLDPRGVLLAENYQGECYDLSTLDLNTTYFWRIDNIDGANGPTVNDVWRFTTANNFLVDSCIEDFESYADDAELRAAWDGSDPNCTPLMTPLSEVTLAASGGIDGSQAMQIAAPTAGVGVTRIFDPNMASSSFETVTIMAKGSAANDPETVLQVSYFDTSGDLIVQGMVINQADNEEWFPITLLIDGNPGWTNVDRVCVQVLPVSGTATMLFDDLCLLYDCGAPDNRGALDLNADCITNYLDFAIAYAVDWLTCNNILSSNCVD